MSTVHVVPLRDLIEHDVPGGLDGIASAPDPWLCIEADGDGECACGPKMEAVRRDDGSVGWVIVHHSLDGRESRE